MLMYILIAVTGLQDPRTNLKATKNVHCRKSFIKNVAQIIDSEIPCVIIMNIITVQGPASVLWVLCFSVDQMIFYYYLQLSQFSPAVMVSGVIGSIPCGHSPATSGQKQKQWPVTAKLQAIKHWSQWMLALTWFLFLLLFSMRTHLALHIHSALLYRWEQILKPLFKTFCYLLHDCINMAFCLFVFALFSNCTGMTRWCGGVSL